MTVLYGSSVADTTLTTACQMATTTGGTETSRTTSWSTGSSVYGEIFSQGTTTGVTSASIPAPTGNGWVYNPGAGTFSAGNWSAVVTSSGVGGGTDGTIRFYKYSGGVYTAIGTILHSGWSSTKTANSFTATAMPATTFVAGDLLYVDLWFHDTTGAGGDNPTIYESSSAVAGVANDMQVTTSAFTAGGGGGPVTTALHVYGTSVAATTLTTAGQLATTTGGTSGTKTTKLGKLTGWGELFALGNTGTWPAGASQPAPSGHGWLLDDTSLEGQDLLAGVLTPIITLNVSSGVATADIHLGVYKRSSAGVYTLLLDLVQSGASITTTAAAHSLTTDSVAQTSFVAGDKLYLHLTLNVTANTSASTTSTVTVGLSTVATGGLANKVDLNTQGYQATASANAIAGLAIAAFVESMFLSGRSRSRYVEAIAGFGRTRSKFLLSIKSTPVFRSRFLISKAQKGSGRSKFTESVGSTGRIRARFIESQALKGRIRSRFYEAAVSKGQARAKFAEAIAQKSGARSKFLLAIGQKGLSRAKYLLSKASKGLARAKFVEAIAQRGQARSKFSLSAVLRGLAESTFKIAVSGGHAITAYMRSHYKVSIRQIQAQRSRFFIRFSQSAQVHSKYLIRFAQAAQSRTRFLIRFGVTGRARSRYILSIRQTALARSRFITRLALVVVVRSKFLVQGILVTLPIKSITHSAVQALSTAWNNLPVLNLSAIRLPVLSAVWRSLSALSLSSVQAPAFTIVHQGIPMPAPNTTILSTITVTDTAGAPVSNASTVNLVVYFPDGSTSNLALTSGITNLGAGQYQAKYNTKQPGEIREVWSIIGADGTTLASAQFLVGVEY